MPFLIRFNPDWGIDGKLLTKEGFFGYCILASRAFDVWFNFRLLSVLIYDQYFANVLKINSITWRKTFIQRIIMAIYNSVMHAT